MILFKLLIIFFVVSLMITLTAFYVAAEFAIVSARKSRIEQTASDGNSLAKRILPIMKDPHKLDSYIAASQVGITLSSIVLGIYGQREIAPLIEPLLERLPFLSTGVAAAGFSATLVLLFLTALQVVLGELVPKSLALQYPERIALWTSLPMRWSANIILRPLIILLNGSGVLIMRVLNIGHEGGHQHVHSPEEIKFLIQQSHEGGLLDEEEHELLDNALRFGSLKVGEIVVPRTRMVAADVNIPVHELLRLAAESDYTRIPIYEEDIDHIIGFVHLKELFHIYYTHQEKEVRSILREVTFVPETKPIDEVWNTLDREQTYLAIVFDEYGGTIGMITREDLLEELFGEVRDEFDNDEIPLVRQVSDKVFLVRGDVSINNLNDRFELDLPAEDAYTIGGLFTNELGRLPQAGDQVKFKAVLLLAKSVSDMAVHELEMTLSQPLRASNDEEGAS